MKLRTLPKKIQLNLEEPKVGGLDISSKPTAIEYGEVLEVGSEVQHVKKGDKLFVKAWALDIITHQGEKYYFCDGDSLGICAIVED